MSSLETKTTKKPQRHWLFWILCIAALLWNTGGLANFVMQLNEEAVASFPAPARAIIDSRPIWATAAFGFAMLSGIAGCILLLIHNIRARPALYFSLSAVLITMIHSVSVASGNSLFGLAEVMTMIVVPTGVAGWLALYARSTDILHK